MVIYLLLETKATCSILKEIQIHEVKYLSSRVQLTLNNFTGFKVLGFKILAESAGRALG